jgi:hypothetical protein
MRGVDEKRADGERDRWNTHRWSSIDGGHAAAGRMMEDAPTERALEHAPTEDLSMEDVSMEDLSIEDVSMEDADGGRGWRRTRQSHDGVTYDGNLWMLRVALTDSMTSWWRHYGGRQRRSCSSRTPAT